MAEEKLLYRPAEAADAIGVSRARCYELIARGAIPSIRIGGSIRVPVEALRAWIGRQLEARAELASK
jgi:excisionase family DNA binding protein